MKKILIVLVSVLLLTGCTTTNETLEVKSSSSGKIKVSAEVVDNEKVVVVAKNISGKDIENASLNLAFYDANNKLVKTEKESLFNLKKDAKNVIVVLKEYNNIKTVEVVSSIPDTKISGSTLTFVTDKIQPSLEENGNVILTKIINNSEKMIDTVNYTLVLYKNDKIVAAYPFYDTGVVKEKTNEIVLQTSNGSKIDYDKKELVINSAYIVK